MRKKLPILLLALIILLQVFSPVTFAASKNKAVTSTVSFCQSDTTPEGAGKVFKPVNNMKMKTNDALDAASEWLGKGYKDMGNGRFVSADGKRVVRMGDADILGKHEGGKHMNFEELVPNPNKPEKMQVNTNYHIYLTD